MVKKSLAAACLATLCLLTTPGLFAEGNLSLELGISNLILQTRKINMVDSTVGEKYWGYMTSGNAGFSFKSIGNKNVKADLAFSFTENGTTTSPAISLDRAYVKARFPGLRITAGKTRLGWGDGFVFNSGDVIFGSTDTTVDLTATEIRRNTKWLTAVNIPLGRFSFLEAVVIPPLSDSVEGFAIGELRKTSGGGRFYTKLSGVKLEGGYFFDQSAMHKPYLALQGNLLLDWNIASSIALPRSGDIKQAVKDSWILSAGLFQMLSINSISTITFRLEGLYRPFCSTLMLYPEIGYSPSETVNLSLRSIWSPIDMSAMLTAGIGWNVFEGFDLNCYAIFNVGDADDNFSWNKDNKLWQIGIDTIDGVAVIMGLTYIY